jgi:hypothetical protein
MDSAEIEALDSGLREVLRASDLGHVVDEVDATIVEGRSQTQKLKIEGRQATDELVAIDYTPAERYELLLDAARRALVQPASFAASAEARLLAPTRAASITLLDPEGTDLRTLGRPTTPGRPPQPRDGRRDIDRGAADEIDGLLDQLDPRTTDDTL